ncbi:ExeA family protein [Thioalkalivibrio sulfidiphilus]|uniref:MSHA biogenesis protein MshM n=1 Tax=Thioalkalivibrio sulfidiphilus (strain HL-EbGR7) TaxID=396588 RepID=B8GR87_THISH|nr:AAA family ATPase [Thioalkalivibrio sulfidiphilus]ACL74341.1 MSHA biogenesis protein MshM [Thioalkalivibrio sulfidiphilus HL-EbGr7]
MYASHFGLRDEPFRLTPDTAFYFDYRAHREALNVLLLALRAGEGFVKVTGEVGTGKTLLCRMLMEALETSHETAYLPNPCLTGNGLRAALARELGLDLPRNLGQHRVLERIQEHLLHLAAAGRRVVVLLDEAQALPDESLEALRLLTNLETERHKLLQVVLFGQPELDERLAGSRLRQLRQRISFSHRLEPLDRAGVTQYVHHRLAVAGVPDRSLFGRRALATLHRASRGIPRLVNILAHKALLAAYGEGAAQISPAHVRRAALDTEDARRPASLRGWALAALGTVGLGAAAAALGAWLP